MILIAMDSFKGSMTSKRACELVGEAFRKVDNELKIVEIPVGDGGEGTAQALKAALSGSWNEVIVTGPDFLDVESGFLILPDGTAVIEMASASGLLLSKKRNPSLSTTYGTGQLISAALDKGCRKIIIGIGGSATNDGGTGMAAALGVRFIDKKGVSFIPVGGSLSLIASIDMSEIDKRLRQTEVIVACDVNSPFYGPLGASQVFAPQKGASIEDVECLDKGLRYLAGLMKEAFDIDVQSVPGSGAAGGLGGGLLVFVGGRLASGMDIIISMTGLGEKIRGADLVITGEGSFDSQSLMGKAVSCIGRLARKHGVPVLVLAGSVNVDSLQYKEHGITAALTINRTQSGLEEALTSAEENLKETAMSVASLWKKR